MIEISKEHTITGNLEAIENAITPIIQQLNHTGLPLDIGIVEKIRNQYLGDQKACAEKIFSLSGFKFDLGKRDQIEIALQKEGYRIGKKTCKGSRYLVEYTHKAAGSFRYKWGKSGDEWCDEFQCT